MSNFDERRRDWEKRIEEVIIEMSLEKTEEGLAFVVDFRPAITEFNKLIASIATARKFNKYYIIPGNENNS